jgi:hypothetical protein
VFPPTSITKPVGGKEPISDRKLEKGDGNFETEKEMIGFEFDGIKRTVRLPAAKARRFIKEAHTMLRRKCVPIKLFQTVIGKLRHATTILPAAEGLFSPVNSILRSPAKSLRLGEEIKSAILDLCSLIHLLGARPTHVRELIPDTPQYIGYHDAAAEGSGGVWFSLEFAMRPILWREEFPHNIACNVVSESNPTGGITNSDLELAAELFAVGIILANAPQIKHATLGTLCDNSPTVSWINRMASKSKSAVAGSLLRGLSFMLYTHHAGRLTTVHVKGEENVMADIASRPTKARALFGSATHSLSDDKFSSSFDLAFPLPNKQVWHLVGVPTWLRSNVFDTLRGKRLDLRLWAEPNGTSIGRRGRYTAASTKSAPKAPPPADAQAMLITFAVAVREGQYGKGRQVKVQSVEEALRAVAQKYVLDGYADIRKSSPAQHNLDLPISRLLKKFGDADPPKEPKLAVPTSTIQKIKLKYTFSSHHMAVADLCIIAFFYLLRVGEYTLSHNQEEKRTIALRKGTFGFGSKDN